MYVQLEYIFCSAGLNRARDSTYKLACTLITTLTFNPPNADCIIYYCILLIVVFQLFTFTVVVVYHLGSSKSADTEMYNFHVIL